MSDLLNLNDRVALVTGAGQGIGARIAKYLSAHGASISSMITWEKEPTKIADEIRGGRR